MDPQWLQEALALARANKDEGYQTLLSAYGPRLYGYFVRATGSHHDAEDLLSELTLRLVKTVKTYDDRGRFEPWLFRIACNMVRDRIRRRVASPISASLSAPEDSPQQPPEPADDGPDVDAAMLAAEASTELQASLNKLDLTTRDMILLRHFADLSFKEIAELYNCPLGTALARVHRGLKALKKMLSGVQSDL